MLEGRISVAQFGHSLFTLYLAQRADLPTPDTVAAAKAAHERVMCLWGKHGNLVLRSTQAELSRFRPFPLFEHAKLDQYAVIGGSATWAGPSATGPSTYKSAQVITPTLRYLLAVQVYLSPADANGNLTLTVLGKSSDNQTPDHPTNKVLGSKTLAVSKGTEGAVTFDFSADPIDLGGYLNTDGAGRVILQWTADIPGGGTFRFRASSPGKGNYPFAFWQSGPGSGGAWQRRSQNIWFMQYGRSHIR
jgi:hypothetical protein